MTRSSSKRYRNGLLLFTTGAVLPVLVACTAAPGGGTSPAGSATALADSGGGSSAGPKVPFDHQPCRSLSLGEQKNLNLGEPVPGKPGRSPDGLAYDNTCEYTNQTLEYTTLQDCAEQRSELRTTKRIPPADLPNAFYDVLGNLWFAKNGYCVAIPNNTDHATREKMARMIAAKL